MREERNPDPMTYKPRIANLDEMLEHVKGLSGDYAECGVYQGDGAQYIYERMAPGASLWLFDTFSGHGKPSPFDDAVNHPLGRYSDANQEKVRERAPHARIVMGNVMTTLPVLALGWDRKGVKFRFVRVDLDHYIPTKFVIEFFRTRMVPGGIMEFDDYEFSECPGATKAVDEVIGKENVKYPPHWINDGSSI